MIWRDLKVAGLLKDIPKNSSFQFDFLLPWKYKRQIEPMIIANEDQLDGLFDAGICRIE